MWGPADSDAENLLSDHEATGEDRKQGRRGRGSAAEGLPRSARGGRGRREGRPGHGGRCLGLACSGSAGGTVTDPLQCVVERRGSPLKRKKKEVPGFQHPPEQGDPHPNPSGKGAGLAAWPPQGVATKRLSGRGLRSRKYLTFSCRSGRGSWRQEAVSERRALKSGGSGLSSRSQPPQKAFFSCSRPGGPAAPASRRRGHLHNTFTFEGSSGVGASRSPCEARFSIIAIRNRNRMTIAVEIQLLSCGRMKQKNLCALKTEL